MKVRLKDVRSWLDKLDAQTRGGSLVAMGAEEIEKLRDALAASINCIETLAKEVRRQDNKIHRIERAMDATEHCTVGWEDCLPSQFSGILGDGGEAQPEG